jgi:hypothetical protein
MSSWTGLLEQANPNEHIVQLYGSDDQLLVSNVSRYVFDGLRREDGVVVIATPDHLEAFSIRLMQHGVDLPAAVRQGRLLFLDARTTLNRFLVDGEPDQERFEDVFLGAIRQLRQRPGCVRIRAFGEMVGLLWDAGKRASAIRLEEYWEELLRREGISLFCAYAIDALDRQFDPASLQALLGVHSHLLAGPRTMLTSTSRS